MIVLMVISCAYADAIGPYISAEQIEIERGPYYGLITILQSISYFLLIIVVVGFIAKYAIISKNIKQADSADNEKQKETLLRAKRKFIRNIVAVIILILFAEAFGLFFNFAKPIIYLYPEEETNVVVELGNPEILTCSYPKYEEAWNVVAKPNGDLVDTKTGRNLYALYWEGINTTSSSKFTEGFCLKGEDTASFLEEKLVVLGLNEREAEEFIVYWLPRLEKNKYNLIRFQTTEEIGNNMPLNITPAPDTTIRVMMEWKGVNRYVNLPEQELITPERTGFVVVEWGGTEL